MPGQWHLLQEGEKSRCLHYSGGYALNALLPIAHKMN
jgi:hypothetical protein